MHPALPCPSRMRVALISVLVAGACGGKQSPTTAAGPDCATVAAHLVDLAERDNAAQASESLAANLGAELERSCHDQSWSSDRRTCLHAAQDQEATLDCPAQ